MVEGCREQPFGWEFPRESATRIGHKKYKKSVQSGHTWLFGGNGREKNTFAVGLVKRESVGSRTCLRFKIKLVKIEGSRHVEILLRSGEKNFPTPTLAANVLYVHPVVSLPQSVSANQLQRGGDYAAGEDQKICGIYADKCKPPGN